MGKTVKMLFGGGRQERVDRVNSNDQRNRDQAERLADQSRVLNDRNTQLEASAQSATRSRRRSRSGPR